MRPPASPGGGGPIPLPKLEDRTVLVGRTPWLLHCLLSLAALSAAAAAADWPQWGGADGRNHVSAEKGLPDCFAPGRKKPGGGIDMATARNVKWVARLGTYAYGNPTVARGKVFVGTDDSALRGDKRLKRTRAGLVHCFDEATGKLLWRLVVPKRTRMPKGAHYGHQHLGVCSSPTVDGDRLYVMTCATEILCLDVHGQANGNGGPFTDEGRYMVGRGKPPVKLQPTDADILWRYDLMDELGVVPHDVPSCSVLIHGQFLYTSGDRYIEMGMKAARNLMGENHDLRTAATDERYAEEEVTSDE